jgi:hypothetical protein
MPTACQLAARDAGTLANLDRGFATRRESGPLGDNGDSTTLFLCFINYNLTSRLCNGLSLTLCQRFETLPSQWRLAIAFVDDFTASQSTRKGIEAIIDKR